MPDIMKMKPKESDGVDSVIIVDGVPVVGTDRYPTSLVDPSHFGTDPDPRLRTTDLGSGIRSGSWFFVDSCHNRWRRSGCRHRQVSPELWIREILARIRIRGSVPLTYGSGIGSGSWYFVGSVIIVDCVPVVGTDWYTTSLVDPWHFCTDPDPRLRTTDIRIPNRIRIIS